MHNTLQEIIIKKEKDLQQIKKGEELFRKKIISAKKIMLIAEIKLASPTNPKLGDKTDILKRAKAYEQAGADAISIITEKYYFKGDISFISQVKNKVAIPVLQKDFVIDPIQIYEAKQQGTDALLLIARLLKKEVLKKFTSLCLELGIEPVVEINSDADLQKACMTSTNIIAVNARDLETFAIDKKEAHRLLKKIPKKFIRLGFSGIQSATDVADYKKMGAQGVLVGTSVMKAKNIKYFLGGLRDEC
jgi:indole-3-glycerol phosphate synthase